MSENEKRPQPTPEMRSKRMQHFLIWQVSLLFVWNVTFISCIVSAISSLYKSVESSICIQSVHACVSFLRWEEPTQNEFMSARVNLYMQKFYVEPLLHAGMLHVERVRRETECKPGKTKLFSHPHFVELNNIMLQESFFFILWCLSDSIIHYLSVSEKVNEVVFF